MCLLDFSAAKIPLFHWRKKIKVNVSANGGLSESVCHWSRVNIGVTCGEFWTNIKLFSEQIQLILNLCHDNALIGEKCVWSSPPWLIHNKAGTSCGCLFCCNMKLREWTEIFF